MNLVFAYPWILGFLVALPGIWWLLRLLPPAPKQIRFPALGLLQGLASREETPARTPLWVLILRMLIGALIILAFAGPRFNPPAANAGHGALLIAIDNDWAAARAWDARQDALHRLIEQTEQEKREVILLPAAPPANGDDLHLIGPIPAAAAYSEAKRIQPQPWPADWKQAAKLLAPLDTGKIAAGVWLAGGLGGNAATQFHAALKNLTQNLRVLNDPENPVYLLSPPSEDGSLIGWRGDDNGPATVTIAARNESGSLLAETQMKFAAGSVRATATPDLPLDIHNRVARFEIEGAPTAAATVLLDQGWQHPVVGLVGEREEETEHSLLSGLFYIDRALKPYADIHIDRLDKLLEQNTGVLVLTDSTPLDERDIRALLNWIKKGGVFLRFAGEHLAAAPGAAESELMPVTLRTGDRAMGGAMSWAAPQKLREFPAASPFYGLNIPADVAINRQILAEPAPDLADHTWAALEDQTPLVTAKKIGNGLSVLFHVPAQSSWSNLPLSGLFVDMLRRIVVLGHGAAGGDFSHLLPQQALDAFGVLHNPDAAAEALTDSDFSKIEIGPHHPPGLYGGEGVSRALNLGAVLPPPAPLDAESESYQVQEQGFNAAPVLLAVAFVLFLLDFIASLIMRGLMTLPARRIFTAALLLALFAAHPAQAVSAKDAVELTSKTYLAYIVTGDRTTDRISEAGLRGLAMILQRRTALDQVGVTGVAPDSDELAFFPLVYWPLTPAMAPVSADAARRINDYLAHGGMILFDSGEEPPNPLLMQRVLRGIDLPPLVQIPDNHVLHRSFYLLDDFPGRTAQPQLWVEPSEMSAHDGVASVLAGNGGWAGAWALDEQGRPLLPCEPGGEIQREHAFRFGVNLVMYALTGNYKSDQLHAQALLERMRQ